MRRFAFILLVLLAVGSAAALATSYLDRPAGPGVTADQITDEFVAGGNWTKSAGAEFLPDGRMLVLDTTGNLYMVNPVAGTSSLFLTIPDVSTAGETGLLDVTLDPAFAANRYLYTYLVEASTMRLRVDRFTLAASGADTLASRHLVWTSPGTAVDAANPYHVGGSLNVGPDGMLYLTTGDNLNGPNAQDLTNVFGKVLRFRPDGTVPTDNPYHDGTGPHVDEIWATGIRNGFRGAFDGATGDFWLGDVGGNNATTAYEEVDLITRGANYGWPDCEGPLGQPKNGASCPSGVTGPLASYSHDTKAGCCLNRAIVGGEVYRGSAFPASFAGTYVYADYPTGELFWLQRSGGSATTGSLKTSALQGGTPVWLGVSPADGNIYYVHYGFGNGQLRRLRYTGGANQPPVIAQATATPAAGLAPLAVTFAGAATDADGDALSYRWTFGDGTSADTPNPTKTYTANGAYTAQLTVTSRSDTVTSAPITISVGPPPMAAITAPAAPATFKAGDTITVAGAGTAADGSPLPPTALSWNVVLLHDDHTHPVTSGTGSTVAWSVPASGGHSWAGRTGVLVTLTATGADGLTATSTLRIDPVKTQVTVAANVAGTVAIDGITLALPTTIDALVGSQHTLSVPPQVCVGTTLWTFASWSNGGAREQTITAAAGNPSLTAAYTARGAGTCGNQLYRAVNLAGPAITVDGVAFEDGRVAPGFTAGPVNFCDQTVPLTPATSAEEAQMVRCSSFGIGNSFFTLTGVPDGSYQVTIWTWEDNSSEVWTPSINGTVEPAVTSGPAGTWQKLVYPVTVSGGAGQIALTSTGGTGNLSALRVDSVLATDTTPPTVAAVSPVDGAIGVSVNAPVSLTFSEPVVPNGGVMLSVDGGAPVAAAVAVSGSTVTLTPSAALTPGTRYRMAVGSGVTDGAGNPAAASSTTFTTLAPAAGQLLVSRSASRAPAVALGGSTWTAGEQVYVYYDTPNPAVSVRFYLDTPTGGTVFHTESLAPWDFNGGGTASALPYTANLAAGSHTISAVATRTDGSTDTATATVTVAPAGGTTTTTAGGTTTTTTGDTATTATGGTTTVKPATTTTTAPSASALKVSRSADRSGAVALNGSTWARGEVVYVFLDVADPAVSVRFHLDQPTTGTVFHTESLVPWDFNGGATAAAYGYTSNLAAGSHTISALLTRPDGTTVTYTATVTTT